MHVPKVQISQVSQQALERIIKESKKPTTIGNQIFMTNYYAYLHNKSAANDKNYAKLLLGK